MMYGFLAVLAFVLFLWIKETKKASKDPDVIEASELGIPIWRYKKYKEAWFKIQEIYKKYGSNTPVSNKMADDIISSLPNMNEWRRYGDRQCSKVPEDFFKELEHLNKTEIRPDFNELFNELLQSGGDWKGNLAVYNKINEIIKINGAVEEWRQYCLSKKDEAVNKFSYPGSLSIGVEDGMVKGEIKNYKYIFPWFFYEVSFDVEISINENIYHRVHLLTEQDILDIVIGTKQGRVQDKDKDKINNHKKEVEDRPRRYDLTAVLRSKGL